MQNEITRFDCKQCGSSIGIQEIPASGVIICEACGVSFRIPNLPDKKLNEVKEEVEARIKELSEKQERSDAWNRKRLQQQLDEQMRLLELIRVEKDRAEADRRRNAFNEGVAAQEAGDFDSAVKWFDDVLLNRKDSAPELEVRWRICMCRYEVERVSLTSDGRNWMYTVSNWRDSNFKDNANCRTVLEQSVGKEHEYYERQMDSISGLMAKCADAARDMDCRVVVLADSRNGKMVKEIESALKAENISAYIAFESGDLREAEPKLTAAMSKAQLMIVVTSSDAGVTSPWMTNHWKRWLRSHTKGKSDLMIFAPGVSLKEKQELRSYKPYAEVRTLIRALTKRLGEAKTAVAGEETTVSGNGYNVPVNDELAEAWYSVAAKGGHAGAQRVLEEQQAAD